jgi:Leucine-rich repeat (LRR) protein
MLFQNCYWGPNITIWIYLEHFWEGKLCQESRLQKVMSDLTQLNYLGLSSMSYAVPDLTIVEMGISSLPNLEHLKLSNNPKIVTIRQSIGSLRKLRNLDT